MQAQRQTFAVSARAVMALAALVCAQDARAATFNLSGATMPGGVSLASNVTFTAGTGVTLTSTASLPADAADGYVEMSWTHANLANISGKQIALQVNRNNAILDGQMNAGMPCTSGSDWYPCSGTTSAASVVLASGNSAKLTLASGSSGNAYFQQDFTIDPGELYRIRYRIDASGLSPAYDGGYDDGFLEVRLKYFTSAQNPETDTPLSVYRPTGTLSGSSPSYTLDTTSETNELIAQHRTFAQVVQAHLDVTVDCEIDPVYDDGTDTIDFQRTTVTAANCDDDIYYGQLAFVLDSHDSYLPTTDSIVYIDDVYVDWDRQVEMEIVDTGTSVVLQSSTLDQGFLVEDIASDPDYTGSGVKLRVHLRSQRAGTSPLLKKLTVGEDGVVTIGIGSVKGTYTDPRLGMDMHLPPREIFDDSSYPIDTECEDPFNTGNWYPCWELFALYDITNQRMFLNPSAAEWSGTSYTGDLTTSGETFFDRIGEANSYGHNIEMLFPIHGAAGTDMTMWTSGCALAQDDGTAASDADQTEDRIVESFSILADLLDGSTTSGATATDFEIMNEPNLADFAPDCTLLDTDRLPLVMNEVALGIESVRPGMDISFAGLEPGDGRIFDDTYLEDTLLVADADSDATADLDPANFSHANFHPYTKSYRPEELFNEWAQTRGILNAAGWTSQQVWMTEFAFSRATLTPGCFDELSGGWEGRGYGDTEQQRLTAREAVAQLSLATEKVYVWGQMSNEAPVTVSGGWDTPDPCWESMASQNKVLFNRVSGTGPLSGVSGTTQYQANPAGAAFLGIADWLSTSDPYAVTSTSATDPVGGAIKADQHYYAAAFDIGSQFAVSLWFYQDYEYGRVRTDLGETTDLYYQNMLYGAEDTCDGAVGACGVRDNGFEDYRRVDVVLSGVPSYASITAVHQVDLATNTSTALSYTAFASTLAVSDVVVGELPTLLVFTY